MYFFIQQNKHRLQCMFSCVMPQIIKCCHKEYIIMKSMATTIISSISDAFLLFQLCFRPITKTFSDILFQLCFRKITRAYSVIPTMFQKNYKQRILSYWANVFEKIQNKSLPCYYSYVLGKLQELTPLFRLCFKKIITKANTPLFQLCVLQELQKTSIVTVIIFFTKLQIKKNTRDCLVITTAFVFKNHKSFLRCSSYHEVKKNN